MQGSTGLEEDDEMREIFIEEAREVIAGRRRSAAAPGRHARRPGRPDRCPPRLPHAEGQLAHGRAASDFGEAAWACEQLYNARLAEAPALDSDLRAFTADALRELGDWVEAIAERRDDGRDGAALTARADALRQRSPLDGPRRGAAAALQGAQATAALLERVPELPSAADLQLDFGLPSAALASAGFDLQLDLGVQEELPTSAPNAVPELLSLDLPTEATGEAFALDLDLPAPSGVESIRLDPALDWQEPSPASESRALPMSEAEFDSVFGTHDAPAAAAADDLEIEADEHRAEVADEAPAGPESVDFADTRIDLSMPQDAPRTTEPAADLAAAAGPAHRSPGAGRRPHADAGGRAGQGHRRRCASASRCSTST